MVRFSSRPHVRMKGRNWVDVVHGKCAYFDLNFDSEVTLLGYSIYSEPTEHSNYHCVIAKIPSLPVEDEA